jgi:hypothetical protein
MGAFRWRRIGHLHPELIDLATVLAFVLVNHTYGALNLGIRMAEVKGSFLLRAKFAAILHLKGC